MAERKDIYTKWIECDECKGAKRTKVCATCDYYGFGSRGCHCSWCPKCDGSGQRYNPDYDEAAAKAHTCGLPGCEKPVTMMSYKQSEIRYCSNLCAARHARRRYYALVRKIRDTAELSRDGNGQKEIARIEYARELYNFLMESE